jgi:hypothetical protein
MKCDTPACRWSSNLEPPPNMKTTLAERRSGIAAVTNFAPPGSVTT